MTADYMCSCCRAPFVNESPLDEYGRCPLCRLGLTSFDAAYSYGFYEGTLRRLIHLFKYGGVQPLSQPLGERLMLAFPRDLGIDILVPMPLHWKRRLARGFNQSELLARAVGKRFNVPVVPAVRRIRSTPAQAGLTNSKRRANVAGAFRVDKASLVAGRRVLLVDDVLTTGATAAACAAALKKAGARSVTLLTLARVDRRWSSPADWQPPRTAAVSSGAF
ncbi:MAG: ComF family protein [Bryobacterales bacterium]|nr:ComF family protein [Bryobacterales bacterium]